jgi:ABC-2 type transport system permease protein
MKMIIKIAKTELRNLFYSPVAWFLTIAFMVQCAIFYTNMLAGLARWQDLLLKNNPRFKGFEASITQGLFLNPDGIFSNALQNLFLFVPLLTMGLIGREISNGTIKLLYSSPVKTRHIVLGKYLAIMIYNLLLVLVLGIFMVSALFNVQAPDYGMLLSAALGFYLLVCAYTAIGLFMSSLTTYQIVSAIGTFITVFVLSRIGGLWQNHDFVRDLTYFLSMSGRTFKLLKGLITTNDIIYFLIIIYMFLGFTLLKLKGGRESKPWYIKAGKYVAVIVSALLIGYVSSRPGMIGYLDATRDNVNTLHPNTQAIVKELGDEPLEITLYTNLLGGGSTRGFPAGRNDYLWTLWDPYLRFKSNLTFKYEYYYDVDDEDSSMYKSFPGKDLDYIAKEMAGGYEVNIEKFKKPSQIRPAINLKAENYRLVMQLRYKGKTTFLRTFEDATFWPDEMQVSAAFKRLLMPKMPQVAFITGDLERSIHKTGEREYSGHSTYIGSRRSLVNLGFDPDTLSLDKRDIPADLSTLVLADPKTALSALAQEKIRQYISRGGNMFILAEPGKQYIINPVLKQLGVQVTEGTLVQLSKNEMPHMAVPYVTLWAAALAPDPLMLKLIKTKGLDTLFQPVPGVAPITWTDSTTFTIEPLLTTVPNKVWLKAGKLVVDSAAPVFSPQEGDFTRTTFPLSVAMHRNINNKEQRIIVAGDADFMSNLRGSGGILGNSYYRWMDYNKFPVYVPRPIPTDDLLSITLPTAELLKIVYVWILPALVLIAGSILLIRRKRQ